jgi:hypothetical protein
MGLAGKEHWRQLSEGLLGEGNSAVFELPAVHKKRTKSIAKAM